MNFNNRWNRGRPYRHGNRGRTRHNYNRGNFHNNNHWRPQRPLLPLPTYPPPNQWDFSHPQPSPFTHQHYVPHFQPPKPFLSPPRVRRPSPPPPRPPSPLPGSEEYTLRDIRQKSEFIKKQLSMSVDVGEVGALEFCGVNNVVSERFVTGGSEAALAAGGVEVRLPVRQQRRQEVYNVQEIYDRIVAHISSLNRGKKVNLINVGSAGYDRAIQQIQKKERLELSRALRNMCANQSDTTNHVLHSIIPDIGIRLDELPPEVIKQLSTTLDMDLLNEDPPEHSDTQPSASTPVLDDVDPEMFFKQAEHMLNVEFDDETDTVDLNESLKGMGEDFPVYRGSDDAHLPYVPTEPPSADIDFSEDVFVPPFDLNEPLVSTGGSQQDLSQPPTLSVQPIANVMECVTISDESDTKSNLEDAYKRFESAAGLVPKKCPSSSSSEGETPYLIESGRFKHAPPKKEAEPLAEEAFDLLPKSFVLTSSFLNYAKADEQKPVERKGEKIMIRLKQQKRLTVCEDVVKKITDKDEESPVREDVVAKVASSSEKFPKAVVEAVTPQFVSEVVKKEEVSAKLRVKAKSLEQNELNSAKDVGLSHRKLVRKPETKVDTSVHRNDPIFEPLERQKSTPNKNLHSNDVNYAKITPQKPFSLEKFRTEPGKQIPPNFPRPKNVTPPNLVQKPSDWRPMTNNDQLFKQLTPKKTPESHKTSSFAREIRAVNRVNLQKTEHRPLAEHSSPFSDGVSLKPDPLERLEEKFVMTGVPLFNPSPGLRDDPFLGIEMDSNESGVPLFNPASEEREVDPWQRLEEEGLPLFNPSPEVNVETWSSSGSENMAKKWAENERSWNVPKINVIDDVILTKSTSASVKIVKANTSSTKTDVKKAETKSVTSKNESTSKKTCEVDEKVKKTATSSTKLNEIHQNPINTEKPAPITLKSDTKSKKNSDVSEKSNDITKSTAKTSHVPEKSSAKPPTDETKAKTSATAKHDSKSKHKIVEATTAKPKETHSHSKSSAERTKATTDDGKSAKRPEDADKKSGKSRHSDSRKSSSREKSAGDSRRSRSSDHKSSRHHHDKSRKKDDSGSSGGRKSDSEVKKGQESRKETAEISAKVGGVLSKNHEELGAPAIKAVFVKLEKIDKLLGQNKRKLVDEAETGEVAAKKAKVVDGSEAIEAVSANDEKTTEVDNTVIVQNSIVPEQEKNAVVDDESMDLEETSEIDKILIVHADDERAATEENGREAEVVVTEDLVDSIVEVELTTEKLNSEPESARENDLKAMFEGMVHSNDHSTAETNKKIDVCGPKSQNGDLNTCEPTENVLTGENLGQELIKPDEKTVCKPEENVRITKILKVPADNRRKSRAKRSNSKKTLRIRKKALAKSPAFKTTQKQLDESIGSKAGDQIKQVIKLKENGNNVNVTETNTVTVTALVHEPPHLTEVPIKETHQKDDKSVTEETEIEKTGSDELIPTNELLLKQTEESVADFTQNNSNPRETNLKTLDVDLNLNVRTEFTDSEKQKLEDVRSEQQQKRRRSRKLHESPCEAARSQARRSALRSADQKRDKSDEGSKVSVVESEILLSASEVEVNVGENVGVECQLVADEKSESTTDKLSDFESFDASQPQSKGRKSVGRQTRQSKRSSEVTESPEIRPPPVEKLTDSVETIMETTGIAETLQRKPRMRTVGVKSTAKRARKTNLDQKKVEEPPKQLLEMETSVLIGTNEVDLKETEEVVTYAPEKVIVSKEVIQKPAILEVVEAQPVETAQEIPPQMTHIEEPQTNAENSKNSKPCDMNRAPQELTGSDVNNQKTEDNPPNEGLVKQKPKKNRPCPASKKKPPPQENSPIKTSEQPQQIADDSKFRSETQGVESTFRNSPLLQEVPKRWRSPGEKKFMTEAVQEKLPSRGMFTILDETIEEVATGRSFAKERVQGAPRTFTDLLKLQRSIKKDRKRRKRSSQRDKHRELVALQVEGVRKELKDAASQTDDTIVSACKSCEFYKKQAERKREVIREVLKIDTQLRQLLDKKEQLIKSITTGDSELEEAVTVEETLQKQHVEVELTTKPPENVNRDPAPSTSKTAPSKRKRSYEITETIPSQSQKPPTKKLKKARNLDDVIIGITEDLTRIQAEKSKSVSKYDAKLYRNCKVDIISYNLEQLRNLYSNMHSGASSASSETQESRNYANVEDFIVKEEPVVMKESNSVRSSQSNEDHARNSITVDSADETSAVENVVTVKEEEDFEVVYEGITGVVLVIKVIGTTILAATDAGKIFCYELVTGKLVHTFDIATVAITSLYVVNASGGDVLIYVGSLDATLRVLNFKTRSVIETVDVLERIQCMECSWGYIFVGSDKGVLIRFNVKKHKIEFSEKISDYNVLVLKATQEGARRVLLVATRNSPVCVRDAMSGLHMRNMEAPFFPTVYTLLLENSLIFCGTSQHDILVYTFQDGQLIFKHEATKSKGVVCMQIVGALLFAGCYNGNVYVYNTKTNECLGSMTGPGGLLLCMEIVDNKIIVGTKANHFKAWRIPSRFLEQR